MLFKLVEHFKSNFRFGSIYNAMQWIIKIWISDMARNCRNCVHRSYIELFRHLKVSSWEDSGTKQLIQQGRCSDQLARTTAMPPTVKHHGMYVSIHCVKKSNTRHWYAGGTLLKIATQTFLIAVTWSQLHVFHRCL